MPIEPVKIDESKLSEEMKDEVNTLNQHISAFNSSKDLSTYEAIIVKFDEIFSACQNEPTLAGLKEELKTNWNKFKSATRDFKSSIDLSTLSNTNCLTYGKTLQALTRIDKLLSSPVESTTSKVSSSSKNPRVTSGKVDETLSNVRINNYISKTLDELQKKYPGDKKIKQIDG